MATGGVELHSDELCASLGLLTLFCEAEREHIDVEKYLSTNKISG